jgi:hypothetical protein
MTPSSMKEVITFTSSTHSPIEFHILNLWNTEVSRSVWMNPCGDAERGGSLPEWLITPVTDVNAILRTKIYDAHAMRDPPGLSHAEQALSLAVPA